MQSKIEVDKEDLYTLQISCRQEIRAGKAKRGIKVEKIITDLKKLEEKNKGKNEKETSTDLQKPNVEVKQCLCFSICYLGWS